MVTTSVRAHRDSAVLVVVDVQERLASIMRRRDEVLRTTSLLIRVAAITGVPIVVTRQYPKGLGETESAILEVLEEVVAQGASVTHVDKVAFDCFAEPAFVSAFEESGRTQLLLAGMETHICIAQTAIAGVERGYDVHVVADACCSRSEEHRTLALDRLAHAGATVTVAESVAYELVGEAGTPEFKLLLAAVKACDSTRGA